MAIDINTLPAPPTEPQGSGVDINSLPPPPSDIVASLPPPPKPPEEHEAPQEVPDQAFRDLGKKYGVNPEDLRAIAPYYGVTAQTEGGVPGAVSEAAKYTAGTAGRMAFGIPQFVYKKLQDEPMRRAIDELNEIGSKQRGYLESGAEMVALPVGGAGKVTEEAAQAARGIGPTLGRLAHGAAVGAGIGAVNAPEGQEVRGAGIGAALGLGAGTAGEIVGKILSKRAPTAAEKELAPRVGGLELDKKADEIATRTADSEKAMQAAVLDGDELSQEQARIIVEQQMDPEQASAALNPSDEVGHAVRQSMQTEAPSIGNQQDAVVQKLAQEQVDNRLMDFTRAVTGEKPAGLDEARKLLDEYAERQGGAQALQDKYQDYLHGVQVDRAIDETGARTQSQDKWWSKGLNFFSGNQFVNRDIDDRFGTKTEQILGQATANGNRASFASKAFGDELGSIDREADKLGIGADLHNPEESGKIRTALDTGNLAGLTPEEQQITQRLRGYTDNFLGFVNKLGAEGDRQITPLSIPKRENFFPHVLRDTPEIVNTVQNKMDSALEQASKQTGRDITDLAQLNKPEFQQAVREIPELGEIQEAMELFNPKAPTDRPQDFSSSFKQLFNERSGRIDMETAARSALERSGTTPEWMLEPDVMKALDKYTSNTLRHLYLRRPLDQMRITASGIRNAGGDYEARYLERIVQDQLGVRNNTVGAAQMQTGIAFMNAMDRIADQNPRIAPLAKAAKAVPTVMQNMVRGMFANVLGYRTRPLLMHGTQSLTKLMPELGMTPYGAYTAMRGVVGAAMDLKGLYAEAERLGNVTATGAMEKSGALAQGVERKAIYKMPASFLQAVNTVGMVPFEKMIQVNRAIAVSTAKVMAHDISAGSQAAQKALARFPRNIQVAVRDAGSEADRADILGRYLNSVTQYNYDRMNMSEFGRTMGPLFSAFSTWPTNTLGDIIYEGRNRGFFGSIPRNLEKYVAPLGMLYAVDYAIRNSGGNRGEMSDRQKAVFGGGGLTSMAPLGSLGAFAKGEAITPPVINAITESVIHPLLEASKHPDRAQQTFMKGFSNSLNSFAPAAGLVHFVTDDLVTYITGHRPEGSTQLERTQEGARTLSRKLK